ncbi:MAG: hypothetical protein Q8R00_00200 [Candidatus Nanoarchaeia archaeon]|nr:hypothetical protein [Candidatus Nanoarchaeia archaeon]
MNRQKASEALREFDEKTTHYSRKFNGHNPEVSELREMQKDYTASSIKLNKALDEPEVIRQNQTEFLDDCMRKSDYQYDESKLDDPRLTQPYTREPKKSSKGLLFSGLAGLLLGGSLTANAFQYQHSNPELESVLKVTEEPFKVTQENHLDYAENNYESNRFKNISDRAVSIYRNLSDEVLSNAFADASSNKKGRAQDGWRNNGEGIYGSWEALRSCVSHNIDPQWRYYGAKNNLLDNKDVRDIVAELILRDVKDGELRNLSYGNPVIEQRGENYLLKLEEESK